MELTGYSGVRDEIEEAHCEICIGQWRLFINSRQSLEYQLFGRSCGVEMDRVREFVDAVEFNIDSKI